MGLHDPIDLYCERTDPSLWSEPVNALTNAAFFVAARVGWRAAAGEAAAGRPAGDLRLLALLAALIGGASLAFHLFATVWAAWADGLSILAFIYVYLARAAVRVLGLGVRGAALVVLTYLVADRSVGHLVPADALNGSAGYLPALFALCLLALAAVWRSAAAARSLATAAFAFAVSLALRTIDQAVCASFPLGTHFAWHLLNGVVIACALRALVSAARVGRAGQPPVDACDAL